MEKFVKTPVQIAAQLEHWFHKFVAVGKEPDNFVLFPALPVEVQQRLQLAMALPAREIPVFVLSVDDGCFVINTTERFIRLDGDSMESLFYGDFNGHKGFQTLIVEEGATDNVKAEGSRQAFEMLKVDGGSVVWVIPTGRAGFKFWHVTNKCDMIGRKYIIQEE